MFLTTEVEQMSVEEWFTMELLDVQDGRSFKTTAQGLLWAALIGDQRLQHGPDHIQLYSRTDGRSRWKDNKSLMKSWTSLLSTRSPLLDRQIHITILLSSSQHRWGVLLCILVWVHYCADGGHTGVKALLDMSDRHQRTRLYLCPWIPSGIVCVCVSLYSNTERLHSLFGSNCPVHKTFWCRSLKYDPLKRGNLPKIYRQLHKKKMWYYKNNEM